MTESRTHAPRESDDQSRRLAELIRRIDEVRALSGLPPLDLHGPEGSVQSVMQAADSLVHEVERNRRRVIETTILLAAITETLSALLVADEPQPALGSLCHFLRGAFRLDWVYLGLEKGDGSGRRELAGPLVYRDPDGQSAEGGLAVALDDPLNPLTSALDRHQALHLTGHTAAEVISGPAAQHLRVLSCLPMGRETGAQPCNLHGRGGHHGSRTAPSGGGPGGFVEARGILAVGRFREEPLDGDHLALLESLGVTVGTVLENGRLTQRLVEAIRFRDNVLESMVDGLVAVDATGNVLAMNEVAGNLLMLDRQEYLGRPLPSGLLEDRELDGDPLELALSPEATTRRAEGWICPEGRENRPARIATTQLRDSDGRVYGAIASFFDLTHIREMERRLRHLDRIAALGRFTSSVAHEIRNPLAGIAAGIEYVGREIPEDHPHSTHLSFVKREIARLERIVSDLSRATRPRAPQPRSVHVETLVSDSIKAVQSRSDAAQAEVHADLPTNLAPAFVDPDHLEQVIVNLILNAVQASPEGTVTVRSWSTPRTANRKRTLWIAVEDSGPGLDADKIDRIFEPFFTTKQEGTGLGLYICHEMVKRNGGEITARNLPEGGAQFLVELPAAHNRQPARG